MILKLCVFSNDPIISYYNKGEIKPRYFNPNNFFDEIHIISFIDNDIDSSKVQTLAGDAILHIHPVGKLNTFNIVIDLDATSPLRTANDIKYTYKKFIKDLDKKWTDQKRKKIFWMLFSF